MIEERFVHDNNVWTSADISAGIDMALAFIAETVGEKIAGDIQLQAEYYPKQLIYTSNSGFLPTYLGHYIRNSDSEIQNFLDNYANAVAHVEIEKISTHFHHHFTLSTQNELWYLANNDAFRLNLKKSFKGYERLGASICKMMQLKVIDL